MLRALWGLARYCRVDCADAMLRPAQRTSLGILIRFRGWGGGAMSRSMKTRLMVLPSQGAILFVAVGVLLQVRICVRFSGAMRRRQASGS
jgi:hypothetical protein